MRRSIALVLVVLVALLTGCVQSPATLDPKTGKGLSGVVAEFTKLSPKEQLGAIASHDSALERSMWKMAGIDDALGGSKAADDAFAAMQQGMAALVARARSDKPTFDLASTRDNFGDAVGAGMFGGMLLSQLLTEAGIDVTNNGETGSGSTKVGDEATTSLDSNPDGSVSQSTDVNTTYKGVDISLHIESEITPCPDADGHVPAKGTYTLAVSVPGGKALGFGIIVDMDLQVDDDAQVASREYTYDANYEDTPGGNPSDSGRTVTFSVDENGTATVHDHNFAAYNQKFQDEAWKTTAFFASWTANSLEKAAQKGWESGRCVDLKLGYSDGPTGLDPDTKVGVTASPVSKIDGGPAGGTVTAKLTSGTKSVSPSGEKVKADAQFTYTAPSEKDKEGVVHFEARSKRGVASADVTFDTRKNPYSIEGGGGDLHFKGTICDLGAPFSASGTNWGLTLDFTPSSRTAGTYTLSGTAGGVPWTGNGNYTVTITGNGNGGTLTTNGSNTVHSSVGDFSHTGTLNFQLSVINHC